MKRNFTVLRNQVDHMPLYNRSHGPNKSKDGGDIALSTHKKQVFLEKEVKSDDTLQSVALEFNVTVAELKRVNNIHKDNEIYARKVLKVPSNPLSILLDKEYFLHKESFVENTVQPVQEKCDIIVETVNNSNCISKNGPEATSEEELRKYSYTLPSTEQIQESICLLNNGTENKTNDVMSCSGADWGISWHGLILFTLILGVGGPMLYIFWFLWGKKEKAAGS